MLRRIVVLSLVQYCLVRCSISGYLLPSLPAALKSADILTECIPCLFVFVKAPRKTTYPQPIRIFSA